MEPWTALFSRPASLSEPAASRWFARIADRLLNRSLWIIGGVPHRFTEIEFYYRGADHSDPFAHAHPIQATPGHWYFHRTGGAYRGGSFKGLDLTFGDAQARAGILIRGVEAENGRLVDGPSLVVDRVLELCRMRTVADLDRTIGKQLAWYPESPLRIVSSRRTERDILACARVGLSLRRVQQGSAKPEFLTRPYRYLTEPVRIRKGKAQIVMGLHRHGTTAIQIRALTNSASRAIEAYLTAYEMGLREGQFTDFFGKDLGPKDVCRLHGIADRG